MSSTLSLSTVLFSLIHFSLSLCSWLGCGYGRLFHHVDEVAGSFGEGWSAKRHALCMLLQRSMTKLITQSLLAHQTLAIRWPDPKSSLSSSQSLTSTDAWEACPNFSAIAESIGGQASTADVVDDYLRWQEEIQFAEEEADALKVGRTHRYHNMLSQSMLSLLKSQLSLLLLLKLKTRRGQLLFLKVNKNSLMMTGLCTSGTMVLKLGCLR